jgi:hypothetical protein
VTTPFLSERCRTCSTFLRTANSEDQRNIYIRTPWRIVFKSYYLVKHRANFTYFSSSSVEQSPSWEAYSLSASQKIRVFYGTRWFIKIFKKAPHWFLSKSRDSSVGVALGYGLDDRGSRVRFPAWAGDLFSSPPRPERLWGPTQPPIQWVPGALSLG